MRFWPPFLALFCLVGEALAQTRPISPLQRVDEAVADLNPLQTSLRHMQIDLRQPTGFQYVYRVPGRDDQFMRSSGALYAVFPKSVYAITRDEGLIPIIPAGTVYHIGMPDWMAEAQQEPAPPPVNRVESRHGGRIDTFVPGDGPIVKPDLDLAPPRRPPVITETRAPRDLPSPLGPSIATDDSYRAARISELLALAVEAHTAARH